MLRATRLLSATPRQQLQRQFLRTTLKCSRGTTTTITRAMSSEGFKVEDLDPNKGKRKFALQYQVRFK